MSTLQARLAALRPLPGWVPHAPTVKQWAALSLTDLKEVLFGGAAGGGKSDWLLMDALQYCDQPGYAALLLRRTWSDLNLPGALLDRAHLWLRQPGVPASWDAGKGRYVFDSGAILAFGHLDSEKDKYRYQGAEFQYVGFDELTQFTESQYTYLASRLRRLQGSNVPLRLRGATNPGGSGHEWVKDRFITRAGEPGRAFIRSLLDDNPHVDREAYDEALAMLDIVTRAQLRNGDWEALPEGGLFKRGWFLVADPPPLSAFTRLCRAWDLAATDEVAAADPDYTAGALVGWHEPTRLYWLLDVQAFRQGPADVEKLIKAQAALDGPRVEIVIEKEGGASGKSLMSHYARTVLTGYDFHAQPAVGSKTQNAAPLAVVAENNLLRLARGPWNHGFINEAVAFPVVPHDDRVDAAAKALQRIQHHLRVPRPKIGALIQVGAGPRERI